MGIKAELELVHPGHALVHPRPGLLHPGHGLVHPGYGLLRTPFFFESPFNTYKNPPLLPINYIYYNTFQKYGYSAGFTRWLVLAIHVGLEDPILSFLSVSNFLPSIYNAGFFVRGKRPCSSHC